MDELEEAKLAYARGKALIDGCKPHSALSDEAQWLIEDLEDAMLDLKEAVISGNLFWVRRYSMECGELTTDLSKLV